MALNTQLVHLAASNFVKYGRQRVGQWTEVELSQPTSVFATITNRCNLHCLQCDIPLTGDRKAELSTDEWKKVIRELRTWLGKTLIRWSGGEPFVRKDMIDLIEYSSSIGVLTGVNTNGHYIDERMAERMAEANVFNVNLSLDGMQKGHDLVRGPGQFQRVVSAARNLNKARQKSRATTKIIIKVTIMETNLDELVDLCNMVQNEGWDALSVSTLEETFSTSEPDTEWWKKSRLFVKDCTKLDEVIDRLKERPDVMFNSQEHLESMKAYYRNPEIPTPPDFKCHVGVDHFRVSYNGDVVMCPFKGTIGNLVQQSPWEIWKSDAAEERRGEVLACRKKCLIGCLYKRNVKEYAGVLMKLF
jgi:MoaA/NifB/PqqE/SkfB family radical SAM enzyme